MPATPSLKQNVREKDGASKARGLARPPYRQKLNEKPHATTPFKKSVQLPDVTGLTSAIASPARADIEFYGYDPKETTQAEGA